MTTLPDRPETALLVVDAQRGVVDHAFGRDDVVSTIATLVLGARAAGTAVIWVQHEGPGIEPQTNAWLLVSELGIEEGEPVVAKRYPDTFEDTNLELVLADGNVGRLVVVGAQSDECVRSTLHGAITRGYDVTLVGDAHTTEDLREWGAPSPEAVIAHTNLYWKNHTAPGRTATVVMAADMSFAER